MTTARLDSESFDPDATERQRWQLRRDLVIVAARAGGASVEILAEVHDLDPSTIKKILRRMKRRYAPRNAPSPADVQGRSPRRLVA